MSAGAVVGVLAGAVLCSAVAAIWIVTAWQRIDDLTRREDKD